MSSLVTFNGQNYIIPATGEVGWGNNVSNYLIAIAAGCLQKTGGAFTLSTETDFGASFGLKSLYYKSKTINIASTGILRLANTSDSISWRNAANNADLSLLVNSSDQLTFNGVPIGGGGIYTPSRAIVTDGSGNLVVATTTATEISYVNGVTSSIQTQLNNKQYNMLIVPVEQYGAIGDGTTDDTTAIRNAITAVSAAGGGTVLLTKNYAVTNSIYHPSNIMLKGAGIERSSIIAKSGSFPVDTALVYSAQANGTLYTTVSPGMGAAIVDIKLDCSGMPNATGDGTGQGYGVFNMTDFLATRVHVLSSQGYGFHMAADDGTYGLLNPTVAFCVIEDCGKHGNQDSIGGGNTSHSTFAFNWIKSPNGTAIDNVHVTDALWIGNKSTGASSHNGQIWSDFGMVKSRIINNYIENGSIHIYGYLAPGLLGAPSNVLIQGNYISNGGSSAIFVSAANQVSGDTRVATGCQIVNNIIDGCIDNAIVAQDAPGIVIANNSIPSWDTTLSGAAAIALLGGPNTAIGTTGCVIAGNTGTVSSTTLYYSEGTAGQTNKNTLYGNNFPGGTVTLDSTSPVSIFTIETPLAFADGSSSSPSLKLSNAVNTGFYKAGTNMLGYTSNGAAVWITESSNGFYPASTNTYNLGIAGTNHWKNLYLSTALLISATSNQLVLGTTNTTTISVSAPAASRIYTVPDAGGTSNFILSGWGQIVNADISASAAIAITKIAPGIANQIIGANAGATANEYKTLTPTTNQVTITHGAGTVTFGTPQNIDTSANVQFGTLALGSTLDSSSILSLTSTTKGFLPPRMTTMQRNAISSPTDGLVVYDTDLAELFLRASSVWTPLSVGGGSGTVSSGTQYQLTYYAANGTTVSGLTLITGSRALVSDSNGLPIAATTTATEIGYVSGVTSAIQTQLNAKAPIASPTFTGTATTPNLAVSGSSGNTLAVNTNDLYVDSTNHQVGIRLTPQLSLDVEAGTNITGGAFMSVIRGKSTSSQISDKPGIILGYNNAGTSGIVAAATQSAGTGLEFWTFNGSSWGARQSISSAGASTFSGNIAFTSTSTQGIVGTTTNDNAAAGNVGQTVSSAVSAVSLSNSVTWADATSISLTAGDWLISVIGNFLDNTNTTVSNYAMGVSTTSGDSGTGLSLGDNEISLTGYFQITGSTQTSAAIPGYRVSLSGTTTHYLKVSTTFSSGTQPQFYGRISAVRIR